jgi:hypothetical protein
MELCKKSMTTLLQSYVIDRAPSEWKGLFKEATNIAFMVKYVRSPPMDPRLCSMDPRLHPIDA